MHYPVIANRPSPEVIAERLYANAYAALRDGRTAEALSAFALMTGVVPRDHRAWTGLGASLEQHGDTERALAAYTVGVSASPASVFCKLGKARTLYRLGRVQEAQRVLDQAEVDANEVSEVKLIDQMRGEL